MMMMMKAKRDNHKENKQKPKLKQIRTSAFKKGKQPKRKRGEAKAPGAIIVVGAANKMDGDEEQKKTSDTPPLLPSKPTGDDGKQKKSNNITPLLPPMPKAQLPIGVPSPPTHPPPSRSPSDDQLSVSSISSCSSSLDDNKSQAHTSYENDVSDSGKQNSWFHTES